MNPDPDSKNIDLKHWMEKCTENPARLDDLILDPQGSTIWEEVLGLEALDIEYSATPNTGYQISNSTGTYMLYRLSS